jgi:ATP-dependent DNA ligase
MSSRVASANFSPNGRAGTRVLYLPGGGLEAWAEVLARGYEGLVAKDPASPYVSGRTLK